MFQDTLLIIKPDYLVKRKALLVYLLKKGFFIKGQRKLYFTPELAAEFYEYQTEDPCFMLQVILLSKGNSEAFVLTKEYAVDELKNVMMHYFGTSTDMEANVHVTQRLNNVQREICFIFPNYIYEPIIYTPEQIKSCVNKLLAESTLTTLNDIAKNPKNDVVKSWKQNLAESIIFKNRPFPRSNHNLMPHLQTTAEQAKSTGLKGEKRNETTVESSVSSDLSKNCRSLNFTTSSCMSCSSFDSGAVCAKQTHQPSLGEIIKARTATLEASELSSSSSVHVDQMDTLGNEYVPEVHFSNWLGDQIVYYDRSEKQECEDNYKEETLKESELLVSDSNLVNNIPTCDLVNANESISCNDLSHPNSNKNESVPFVIEQNEQTEEEISPHPEEFKEVSENNATWQKVVSSIRQTT